MASHHCWAADVTAQNRLVEQHTVLWRPGALQELLPLHAGLHPPVEDFLLDLRGNALDDGAGVVF